MTKSLLSLALLASCAFAAHAKDYGVQGNVWPVTEVDVRQLLVESASRVDWSGPQAELKAAAENYLDRLPKRNLPVSDKTVTQWFDPSVVLSSDIQMPVKQSDGTYQWRLMYPKGTKVNPLEKYRPVTAMLFVDSADEEQRRLVDSVLALEPNRIVIVESGQGSVKEMNDALKRPIFHAPDAMLSRFQVRNTPTLVYAGEGDQRLYLGITSFARPFDASQVVYTWPALRPAVPTKPSGAPR